MFFERFSEVVVGIIEKVHSMQIYTGWSGADEERVGLSFSEEHWTVTFGAYDAHDGFIVDVDEPVSDEREEFTSDL